MSKVKKQKLFNSQKLLNLLLKALFGKEPSKSFIYQHTKLDGITAEAVREGAKVTLKLPYLSQRRVLRKNQSVISCRKFIRTCLKLDSVCSG